MCRSVNGCWTCRLRKKKCDENHPACFRCVSLHLDCHGYGPRPHWMDRGHLQREEARKLKATISALKSNSRECKSVDRSEDVYTSAPEALSDERSANSAFSSGSSNQTICLDTDFTSRSNNLRSLGGDSLEDLHLFDEPLWSTPFHSASFLIDSLHEQPSETNSCPSSDPQEILWKSLSRIPPVMTEECAQGATSVIPQDFELEMDAESMAALYEQSSSDEIYHNSDMPPPFACHNTGVEPALCTPHTSSVSSGYSDSLAQNPQTQTSGGLMEDALLMNYFDHVFYIYCPFYSPTNQRSRGWLFSVLKRDPSAYHAALALAELHNPPCSPHDNPHRMQAIGNHYGIALQELQAGLAQSSAWINSQVLATNVGLLTATLHLLFYELSNGGKSNWQMHLAAASVLTAPLVEAQSAMTGTALRRRSKDSPNKLASRSEEDVAINFLLSFFVYIDTIACVSTRSAPTLALDHKLILETSEISLASLTGCSAWVMILILEISSLDKWKREENIAHRLSLAELANRGRRIEARLRRRLADMETGHARKLSANSHITRIFALAAITYLHVVISGAYPEIHEIMESTSKTIDALHNLSNPRLLRNVVWPFCISGCLAADAQQDRFRELVSSPEMAQPEFATCLEAFEIMKECWRLRKTGSTSDDWATVMKRRGAYILLG